MCSNDFQPTLQSRAIVLPAVDQRIDERPGELQFVLNASQISGLRQRTCASVTVTASVTLLVLDPFLAKQCSARSSVGIRNDSFDVSVIPDRMLLLKRIERRDESLRRSQRSESAYFASLINDLFDFLRHLSPPVQKEFFSVNQNLSAEE